MESTGCKPPEIAPKPSFIKQKDVTASPTTINHAEQFDKSAFLSKTQNKLKPFTRVGSLEHATPKLWCQPKVSNVSRERNPLIPELPNRNELPRSPFANEWKPVPRTNLYKNLNVKETIRLEDASKENQSDAPAFPEVKNKPLLSVPNPETDCNPTTLSISETNRKLLSNADETLDHPQHKNNKKIQYRPSFQRDPKSPGFGSLKQLWVNKSNAGSFSPKPFEAGNVEPLPEKRGAKIHSSSGITGGGNWQHVNSPTNAKGRNDFNYVDNSQCDTNRLRSATVDFLTPKPFRSLSLSDETSCVVGVMEKLYGNTFNFDFDNHQNSVENNLCSNYEASQSMSKNTEVVKTTNDNSSEHQVLEKNFALSHADVGIYQSLQDSYGIVDGSENTSLDAKMYQHQQDDLNVDKCAIYHEGTFDDGNNEQTTFGAGRSRKERSPDIGQPPELPPRDFSASAVPPPPMKLTEGRESPPLGYLPMSGATQTEDISYEYMSHGTEIKAVNYNSSSVVPPPIGITPGQREYHDIDDSPVPSPPQRNPPQLPSVLLPQDQQNNDKFYTEPPPLPPDNTVGRRSMMLSMDKKRDVAQDLQDHAKVTSGPGEKKLNYIEVDTISEDKFKSNKPGLVSHQKINYSDIVVPGENGVYHEGRSGSCTSEEGFASSNMVKKQKNVKKKLQSILPFSSKDNSIADPKTSSKESQEKFSDFDKERNKKKRLSNRFLRKKTKDDIAKKILPSTPTRQHITGVVPIAPSVPVPFKKISQDDTGSTFQAYPSMKNTEQNHPSSTPKVSSFLHGGRDSTADLFKKRASEPPLHTNLNIGSTDIRPITPPRAAAKSLSIQLSLERNEGKRNHVKSMPEMDALLAKPYKLCSLSPTSPSFSASKEMGGCMFHQSKDENPQLHAEAVDGEQDHAEVYVLADDNEPLPNEDTIYENVCTSHMGLSPTFSRESNLSKFLQSEPLYQTYRDRTVTSASGKKTSNPQITSKARANNGYPGNERRSEFMSEDLTTSTLWRTIPEVIENKITEGMTQEEVKLQQAQFEVITSQASYIRSLNILVNHFMRDWAMESTDVLPLTDRHVLFSNIETVCSVERSLLEDLENHFWKDFKLTQVCDVISHFANNDFSVYVLYIQNQVYQDRVLTKLQRNHEKFAEELCRLESSPICNKLPLLSFLILPMQRVTRLPLLISAIVNAADAVGDNVMYKKSKHALGVVNKLVKKCNEGARQMQQMEQLAEIASLLDYSSSVKTYALVSRSRSLVKKGEMNVSLTMDSKKAAKSMKLWLFLFTDVLLFAKKKSFSDLGGSSARYEVIDWANRQYLVTNERAMTDNAIFLVVLENQAGKRIEMSLMPLAQNELSRWTEALNPPTLGITGDSIYESWDCPQYTCIYPYNAQQPDELTIDVGDVMQVLKKTSDGWLEGERLGNGESGWFPRSHCEEIEDEHVKSRNMKNLYKAC